MKRQKYGRLLFTSSALGMFGHPWQAYYGAAKAGLVGLSNRGALEGRDHGILSNALLPGARTRLAREIDWSFRDETTEIAEAFRRMGSPVDSTRLDPDWVTPLAVYLVSERCTTTHGVFSAVSGQYAEVFDIGRAWAEDLRRIVVPSMLIWGERDIFVPIEIGPHGHAHGCGGGRTAGGSFCAV